MSLICKTKSSEKVLKSYVLSIRLLSLSPENRSSYKINSFVPNTAFLYPLKTSENHKVFCFQEVEKGCTGNKWVKVLCILHILMLIIHISVNAIQK